ncbi:Dioxygenases related to 2-nitropropane dioxygenase [hydrothermal vent metagenome]|uniref:Dioxygenases related to 2-nitropropane dioxygenase n=1 Tax=hydrothermal vent metagenome TaxID=652676 RepID=A0A3B0RW70_9ZZZZ
MSLPSILKDRLRLPLIGSPMFILSGPELVTAQCKAGIIGAFPSLNARTVEQFDDWLSQISEDLAAWDQANPEQLSAPFAVNQIVHRSNARLEQDVEICVKHKVPVVITSLGARVEVFEAIHSYGGIVLHDIINDRFAHKAIEKGADGLIAVAAGAGGHAGPLSPFALIQDIRKWFDGPLLLSGSIATGQAILAAQIMGADMAYAGSMFIASDEARAVEDYKQMVVDCDASSVVNSNLFTGIHGNYLAPSIAKAGLDPMNLPASDPSAMNFGSGGNSDAKAWKDIWGCGQGIGAVTKITPVAEQVNRLLAEYNQAKASI